MNAQRFRSVSLVILAATLITSCSTLGHTSNDAAKPSASSSGSSSNSFVKQSPAHGLTLEAPSSVTSDKQPMKDQNGLSRINYYVTDQASPAIVDVEYYTNHSQTAAGIASKDKAAYAADGVSISPEAKTVKGSSSAYTFSWEQSATPPWNNDTKKIKLSCQAVLSDGPSGYAYGVYVCAPKDNTNSLKMTQHILDSIEVRGA